MSEKISKEDPNLTAAEKDVLSSIISKELTKIEDEKLLRIIVDNGKVIVDFYSNKKSN